MAPESNTTNGSRAVGKRVAIAGRVSPGCSFNNIVDAAICAPVLPAETNASDSPLHPWIFDARRLIGLFGLPRTAADGLLGHLDVVGRFDDV